MIGRYGEVVLMDWGIAKQIRGSTVLPPAHARTNPELLDPKARLFSTRNDQCVGTPAYMSPEQAMGQNDQIDERSDIYSATVLLHELLSLRHYLAEHDTYQGLMVAINTVPMTYTRLLFNHHPNFPAPRAELLHIIAKGLAKDPAQRYQSALEMTGELQRAIDGRCRVSCPATTAKRLLREVGRFVDRYPLASPFFFYAGMLVIVISILYTFYSLIR